MDRHYLLPIAHLPSTAREHQKSPSFDEHHAPIQITDNTASLTAQHVCEELGQIYYSTVELLRCKNTTSQ